MIVPKLKFVRLLNKKKTKRQKVVKLIYLTLKVLRKTDLGLIVYGPHVRQSTAMPCISLRIVDWLMAVCCWLIWAMMPIGGPKSDQTAVGDAIRKTAQETKKLYTRKLHGIPRSCPEIPRSSLEYQEVLTNNCCKFVSRFRPHRRKKG